jgi:TetR/AcrR family transcriptional repressor of lmrAB and yxaGH operons
VTAELLRAQGYNATGINQIVARSGAPKGSLYFHFPGGKEELAVVAMKRAGGQLRRAIEAIVSSSDDVDESLGGLVDALAVGLQRSGYREGCPIATVTLEAAAESDAVRATAAAVFASWTEVLQQRLVAAGLSAADAERRALFALSAIEGALILARARHDLAPLVAVRDELAGLSRRDG